MMKYVRTIYETIYEIAEEDEHFYYINYPNEVGFALWAKDMKDVVKEADTIEDLCDGLIVEDKDNPNNWFVMEINEYKSKDNVDKKYMTDRWNFYAFIKTEKGLIYKAKMNNEGVLKLL